MSDTEPKAADGTVLPYVAFERPWIKWKSAAKQEETVKVTYFRLEPTSEHESLIMHRAKKPRWRIVKYNTPKTSQWADINGTLASLTANAQELAEALANKSVLEKEVATLRAKLAKEGK